MFLCCLRVLCYSKLTSSLFLKQFHSLFKGNRSIVSVKHLGPMTAFLDGVSEEIKLLQDSSKHWVCKGRRSVAVAATLLQQNEIVAIPTDTVYGLVGLASSNSSIQKLYEIKNRSDDKPLSISVSSVNNVQHYGVVDHLPRKLLTTLLPGPFTLILKRTPALNPALNPNHDTVGIRVPNFKFINCVSEIVGPLALTSANVSNEPSCLYAREFKHLWPELGAIFHDSFKVSHSSKKHRKGSTIVDLTEPNYYKIVRPGIGLKGLLLYLGMNGLKPRSDY
ncbi:threonyl-carbamoyl synthesis 1 [Xylocopa sonorina]|uniref:threonyl-carbamoyl synthesis 1 n=1 Tax=Xylocopa sonorina TaxID=1818115 RepID=UPI00403AE644